MRFNPRSLPGLAAGAALLLAVLALPAVRGGATKNGAQVMVFLDDGFVLQGMDRREGKYEENDKQLIFMPSGFFFLDDGARRQYFGEKLMRKVVEKDAVKELSVYNAPDFRIYHPGQVPPVDEVVSVGAFDEKWNRTVKFRTGLSERSVEQHLSTLTPYYARTDATKNWIWPAVYLTRELGPAAVRELLSNRPDFAEDKSLPPDELADRRFRYCDFFVQAGWYDEAENELGRLLDDNPSDKVKEQAKGALAAVAQLRSREQFETLKLMHNAGQYRTVRKRLADFPEKSADAQTAIDFNSLRDSYQAADKAQAEAARFLDDLSTKLGRSQRDAPLVEAATALRADLQPDVLPRLEVFLGQARQAERQVAGGQTPSAGPAELVSYAVTGWLGALPEGAPETASRLWHARLFALKYLAADARARKPLLDAYLGDRESPATVDDFTRLIPLLPPPQPEEKIADEPMEMKVGNGRDAISYLLQTPPEYRPTRNYPVLIVLHQSGEGPADMLKRWADAAATNGYLLVAPQWGAGGAGYGFSEREHAVVLETLRDLRRRFAVDSDRVFLFGLGQGGAMAFDVGLSHPDQFAGVLPMSMGPSMFSERYYRNGQYLPFYIVSGDRSGVINDHIRTQFNLWVNQYPMIWIQYKGRGVEWYGGEVPWMFDWMRNKKREFPLQELARDFTTHRATDNSFYWLTTDGVQGRCLNSESDWKTSRSPATLQAHIDLTTNTVTMRTVGLTQVTLWLGRNDKSVPMIEFDKPLTVKWDRDDVVTTVWKARTVTPRLETLLEDLADRGDRQRLFVAKLEFPK